MGRTLLAILCLLLSLTSLWFACLVTEYGKAIWKAEINDEPPLPPDATAFEVFVEWPLPIFLWGMKLFIVGFCVLPSFLLYIGGMLAFLIGAVMVMVGKAP